MKKKRILSYLLAAAIVFTNVPMSLLKVCAEEVNGATEFIPVHTVEELYNIRLDLAANYRLMNDIDLTEVTAPGGDYDFMGNGWNPIGSGNVYGAKPFTGVLDGGGHAITGMRIDVQTWPAGTGSEVYLGLFAQVNGTVQDLVLMGGSVCNKAFSGRNSDNPGKAYAGGLAGYSNNGVIYNVFNNNKIVSRTISRRYNQYYHDYGVEAHCYSGGVIGFADSDFSITGCANFGEISAESSYTSSTSYSYTYASSGGIIGYVKNSGDQSIAKCFNAGTIFSSASYPKDSGIHLSSSGGIIGYIYSGKSAITNCYNAGKIEAIYSEGDNVYLGYRGGIAGVSSYSSIQCCYNIGEIAPSSTSGDSGVGGGISGTNESGTTTITDSYYLAGTGQNNTGAVELTKKQMQLQSMYVGFDFDTVWTMAGNTDYLYPELQSVPMQFEKELVSIAVATPPTKTDYVEGEDTLDLAGGKLTLTYNNGTTEVIGLTIDMVSSFDNAKVGRQTLTVTYQDKTATFTVTVHPSAPSAPTLASKTDTSVTLTARSGYEYRRDDGPWQSSPTFTGLAPNSTHSFYQRVAETDTTHASDASPALSVTTDKSAGPSLSWKSLPARTSYEQGEELDLTGGVLLVTDANGGKREVALTTDMISGYDKNRLGSQSLTVTCEGMQLSLSVTVEAKILESENKEVTVSGAADAVPGGAVLKVEPQENSTIIITDSGKDKYNLESAAILNIYLEKDGEEVQPDGRIKVSIAVPENLDGSKCRVLHIDKDGKLTDMNAVYENGRLVFETDHFSLYTLAELLAKIGDLNGDGKINSLDGLLLLRHLNSWNIDISVPEAMDINGDGKINSLDGLMLLRYLNGWKIELG